MKVTLKTDMTWPRHGKVTVHAGTTIEVPNEVANDWIKRDLAEEANSFVPVQPKVK
jgi:hypothetical protein